MKRFALLMGAVLAAATSIGAMAGSGHWGYSGHSGPEHWGDLSPDFTTCKTGKAQSPIDIRHQKGRTLKPIDFHFETVGLEFVNNGHTLQVNLPKGSWSSIRGERYELLQFHFHGPSEHTVDGRPVPMEVHLVHKNTKGGLGVVGVLMIEGQENKFIQMLWSNAPAAGKSMANAKIEINASQLLPADRSYYHYTGSLTTPPCSEGVNWNVMAGTISVSKAQIEAFNKLFHGNARPVQPLNGRSVKM